MRSHCMHAYVRRDGVIVILQALSKGVWWTYQRQLFILFKFPKSVIDIDLHCHFIGAILVPLAMFSIDQLEWISRVNHGTS